MLNISIVLLVLCIIISTSATDSVQTITAALTSNHKLIEGNVTLKDNLAIISYTPSFKTKGWSEIHLKGNPAKTTMQQSFAMGYLEGYYSSNEILSFFTNQYTDWFGKRPQTPIEYPQKLEKFMKDNLQFVRKMSRTLYSSDPYWRHVAYVLSQFDGIVSGYAQALKDKKIEKSLNEFDLWMLQAAGDLENLIGALREKDDSYKMTKEKIEDEEPLTDCSALIKVLRDEDTGAPSDILAGHSTWRSFTIINHKYVIAELYFDVEKETRRFSYSSSPSFISSKDDFYTVYGANNHNEETSHMAVMETTNSIFNTSLYDGLTPISVLCWIRSVVANQMATNGREWTSIFAKFNSGSYNNQWMVIDYRRFTAGQPIQKDTLWILEQIPLTTESADVSNYLMEQGFWPSFNIPYFPRIYNASGYPEAKKKFGDDMDYEKCPRHLIFNQQQATVNDVETFGATMQYNDYLHDPLSKKDPAKSIASRYDLRNTSAHAFGAIDSKVTSLEYSKSGRVNAICGPSRSHNLPAFSWSNPQFKDLVHDGQPDKFEFDWVSIEYRFKE